MAWQLYTCVVFLCTRKKIGVGCLYCKYWGLAVKTTFEVEWPLPRAHEMKDGHDNVFLMLALLLEDIFLITFYDLYFNHHSYTYLYIPTFSWSALVVLFKLYSMTPGVTFQVVSLPQYIALQPGPIKGLCTIPMLGSYIQHIWE